MLKPVTTTTVLTTERQRRLTVDKIKPQRAEVTFLPVDLMRPDRSQWGECLCIEKTISQVNNDSKKSSSFA